MAERGLDPRDFVLLPFGGAGPTHANLLAEEIGIARILVPIAAGPLAARDPRCRHRRAGRGDLRPACRRRRCLARRRTAGPGRAPRRALRRHALCRPGLRAARLPRTRRRCRSHGRGLPLRT
ncbi:hydantoinase/oxoprolinase family protein [Mangrovicoccus ximenensis]|uniref:hydantoinase/oxoprolinase family protein n=1 Tax=Mangrovicoccus ximenensis TaxID=1911570 RepID=UPI001374F997